MPHVDNSSEPDFLNSVSNPPQSENISHATSKFEQGSRRFGLVLASIFGGAALGIVAIAFPFIKPGFRKICLPYVPATDTQVSNVLKALKGSSGKVIDLGSGDGRLVFAAAKQNFVATGVELNPWLVIYSKFASMFNGTRSLTSFEKKDLFKVNFTKYDNVIIFGVDQLMPPLEELLVEVTRNSRKKLKVIVCRFPFPNLQPLTTIGSGIDTVWIYKLP